MYRRRNRSTKEYKDLIANYVDPLFYKWCESAQERGWLLPKIVYGYFPCNSDKNELVVFSPDDHAKEFCRRRFDEVV